MHRYEYTLSDGREMVMETMARFNEARKTARCMAISKGLTVTMFTQIF